MGGIFGNVAKTDCVTDLFYGTDYLSHLGTRKGGMAVLDADNFSRAIHNLENSYFRTKFESDLDELQGSKGIGVISDTESQPIIVSSHLGTFGIVTVSKINNIDELSKIAFDKKKHFSETGGGGINPTELVAMLISEKNSFEEGIEYAQECINGSCSMLLLTLSTLAILLATRLSRMDWALMPDAAVSKILNIDMIYCPLIASFSFWMLPLRKRRLAWYSNALAA